MKPPKKIVNKGIDPVVYLAANEFYRTAIEIKDQQWTRALVVNISLSIELYFKCILATSEYTLKSNVKYPEFERKMKTARGHKLYDDLFKILSKSDQLRLSQLYFNRFERNFEENLKEVNENFIEYRYAHEQNFLTTSTTILFDIAETLKEYIENEMSAGNYSR